MNQELDERFSIGNEIYARFSGIELSKPKTRLNKISLNSLYANNFEILGSSIYPSVEDELMLVYLLSESHLMVLYDQKTKEMFFALYTCSPEKDGRKTFDYFKKKMKKEPDWQSDSKAIVKKEVSLKEEKGYSSIHEAVEDLKLNPEDENYLSCVFYDIPEKNIDENKLEQIITKAVNVANPKPTTELVHRFDGQGYTYLHKSRRLFGGGHSYPGLKSFHQSVFGKVKHIVPVLASLEKTLESETRYLTLRKAA